MRARDVLGMLLLENGRLWPEAAEGWQFDDAVAVLEGGRPYNFLTRARGGSKTTDLAACALALLLTAKHGARLYWLAADQDQGRLALDAIAGFVARTPGLGGLVDLGARRVAVSRSAASLEVLAADAPGAWGLLPAAVFVDELAQWADTPQPRRLWEAVSSAVAKLPDAKLVVLTTAGDPVHFSAKILEHAKGSQLWRVNEVSGPPPWMAADRVAEQRARLPQAVFEQLFLNRWVAADGAFLDPGLVDAAFTLDGPAVDREADRSYVAGLDLGHVNDRSVFALGHREGGATHLDRLRVWEGSRSRPVDFGEVERFVVAAHKRFGFRLRIDPWQGLDLAQRLRAAGVRTDEFHFSTASKQRLASALLEGINGGTLRLYAADGLRDELVGLRVKQTSSGAWTFDHAAGGHDDRAVALALMLMAALDRPVSSWRPLFAQSEAPKLARQGFVLLSEGRFRRMTPAEAEAAEARRAEAGEEREPGRPRMAGDLYSDPARWRW
jgi:hypothetical protein